MSSKEAIDYLQTEIQKKIKSFKSRIEFYRKGTFKLIMFTAILSALTTFLIGIFQVYELKILSVLALATSSGMTIVTAWDSFFNFRLRWIKNNETLMRLYELSSDIQYNKFKKHEVLEQTEIDKYYEQYKKILRDANENWKQDRLSKSSAE